MNSYQFTVAVRVVETGELIPVAGLLTPIVSANTKTEALNHPDIARFCEENKVVVFQFVGG